MDQPDTPARRPPVRPWTPGELARLRALARTDGPAAIAAALGRSLIAIRTKAAHERIVLRGDRPGWSAASADDAWRGTLLVTVTRRDPNAP